MDHHEHVAEVLKEFGQGSSDRPPFSMYQVWNHAWPAERMAATGAIPWRDSIGIYVFVDFCTAAERHDYSSDIGDRYSIIRYFGRSDYRLGDRLADYCCNVGTCRLSGAQRARRWSPGKGNYLEFMYRELNIILAEKQYVVDLERFLLERVKTEHNDRGVSKALRMQSPRIYDSAA
jgi:hypothetical protein